MPFIAGALIEEYLKGSIWIKKNTRPIDSFYSIPLIIVSCHVYFGFMVSKKPFPLVLGS